jgi:hypothetical protein
MEDQSPIKIKDMIEFLQSLNPEANVFLDKDGWYGRDKSEMIKGLFVYRPISKFNDEEYLMINN